MEISNVYRSMEPTLKTFSVIVTRERTESTTIEVKALTADDAADKVMDMFDDLEVSEIWEPSESASDIEIGEVEETEIEN